MTRWEETQPADGQGWSLQNSRSARQGQTLAPWPGSKGLGADDTTVSPGTLELEADNYFGSAPRVPPKDSLFRGYSGNFAPTSNPRGRSPLRHPPTSANQIAPWDDPPSPSTSEIAPWENSQSSSVGQIAPWADPAPEFHSTATAPISTWYEEAEDRIAPPPLRTKTSRADVNGSNNMPRQIDTRNQSFASNTTAASGSPAPRHGRRDSKSKIGGFLYERSRGLSGGQGQSGSSTPTLGSRANLSLANDDGVSSSPLRPRTPATSADIAPWENQNFQDPSQYGPPTRQVQPDRGYNISQDSASSQNEQIPHRFHFPGHGKTHRGKENGATERLNDNLPRARTGTVGGESSRPGTSRRMTEGTPLSSRPLAARATSPMPGDSSPGEQSRKGGLLSKFRRKDKSDKGERPTGTLRHQQSANSLHDHGNNGFASSRLEPIPSRRDRDTSIATFDSGATIRPSTAVSGMRKESKGILHSGKFPTPRRGLGRDSKDEDKPKAEAPNENLWNISLDLSQMEGIVNNPATSWTNDKLVNLVKSPEDDAQDGGAGAWDAPDSWAVKRVGGDTIREHEEEEIVPKAEDSGVPHGLRVFRIDFTFATLSTGVNTTAEEILQILGKKSFLQDDLNTYQIVMKKQDLQRQLAPGERPIAIQKRLLEQAGYVTEDHIEEIGREDNSYLCRFTFVPTKISGYYSLDKDHGLSKLPKFRDIDLSARQLMTIPIALYSKAGDIHTLNLSRNLALDVPKDFIQACAHIRTIIFTASEARELPPSFSLATTLTTLDVSNNRLERLDLADLGKLQALIHLKLSNNKLTTLPAGFQQLTNLRRLNISSNYLKVLPKLLFTLHSLQDLDFSFNDLEKLPSEIGQLRDLERLVATNNRITGNLPREFGQLYNLKELDLRHNFIGSMDVISLLPQLEQLSIGVNVITRFEGSFPNLRVLTAENNPISKFRIESPMPTLTLLDLSSCKLMDIDEVLFAMIPNVAKLVLDKNQLKAIPNQIGALRKLSYLSLAKNPVRALPKTIGCLQELETLDLHECNLRELPEEIWCCFSLKAMNISSNIMESFPTLNPTLQAPVMDLTSQSTSSQSSNPVLPLADELTVYDEHRRPSVASSGYLSVATSPVTSTRKGSMASMVVPGGRQPSVASRTNNSDNIVPMARKDSNIQTRLTSTFAGSLKFLSLADNRLDDDVFDMLTLLPQLRVLNLSYNELDELPEKALRKWSQLQELYLSGNNLNTLPSDDLGKMETHPLRILHLNGNKLQTLPAEMGKIKKLSVLDIGSNQLKYNVTNYRYDWNWNSNPSLRYLNFSGNKRLEIKPQTNNFLPRGYVDNVQDLTNFNRLGNLRILGLMDVTLTIPSVPDQTNDRRVRSSVTQVGSMTYGMADTLGRHEHLSIIDMLVEKFRGHDAEVLLGMFDGQSMSTSGSKVAKYLAENFGRLLGEELGKIKAPEGPQDALRRSFLALNKELASIATEAWNEKQKENRLPPGTKRPSTSGQMLTAEDVQSGGVATVMYLDNMELFVANVGDAEAILVQTDGSFKVLTSKHSPTEKFERQRIRDASGYVSRHGKLNDTLEVSRAFGYIQLMPAVMAAPSIRKVELTEVDEMVILASRELWDYLTPEVARDVARSERRDVMRSAQKLRDLAISFGATSKIMVMVIGVSELKKRERRNRGNTVSMGPSQLQDDQLMHAKQRKRGRGGHEADDKTLERLDREIDAPEGDLSLVFTDIKGSTALWELNSTAMRAANRVHNELLRRQLRNIGGYEVKTEGDAFMVAFPTATSALLWCFSVQSLLLTADWPDEIIASEQGQEITDADGNIIYRGLSVRMGIHWGNPVCEPDPLTRRMDYFGPMVNRASRISSVADGGQITVSTDFVAEIQRTLEAYSEFDRSGSNASDDTMMDDAMAISIRRDLRALSTQGFEVKELGERKLKGLENPEYIYLMYPHSLAARLTTEIVQADAEAATASTGPASLSKTSKLNIEPDFVWDLWKLGLRLEMLCSALEDPDLKVLRAPETAIMERMKNRGGEISDTFLVQFLEHLISRIETCVTTLQLRNMLTPFGTHSSLLEQAMPIGVVMSELMTRIVEWKELKGQ